MSTILKLQRVQNSLARVVLQQPKRSHAQQLLRTLHWLPVQQRIHYKSATLTYKTRATSTLDYLSDLISARTLGTGMSLRSASRTLLIVPSTRTALASRDFNVCAPMVWSTGIYAMFFKTFRTGLETFLFEQHFLFSYMRKQR